MPAHSRFGPVKPHFQVVETARFCRRELTGRFALPYALFLPIFALIYRLRSSGKRRSQTDRGGGSENCHFHENYSFVHERRQSAPRRGKRTPSEDVVS